MERARAGDSDAFETLYARYSPEILWFCRRKLRSREDAEDAAQTTFATAYRELLQSEDPIELRPWLYGIARNRCLTVLRARRTDTDQLDDDLSLGDDAVDAVVRRQDLRELFVDLRDLPDRQRSALLLSEVGGLSHAQIASTLECRPNQVKALVFQARTNLTDSRSARGVACAEIRLEIASARGAALLRRHLRRHLNLCPGCKQFEASVKRERSAVAFGLSLFPGLGSGGLAAAGGAARLRLAQLLADVPFGASVSSGGWRWAAAVAGAAAATGGGVAAVEIGAHVGGASSPRAVALLAPPRLDGRARLDGPGVSRFTAAPNWAEPARSAVRRDVSGPGGHRGAVTRRYVRKQAGGRVNEATQTLTPLTSQLGAGGSAVGAAGAPLAPASSSAPSPRSDPGPSHAGGAATQPDHGPAKAGGGSDRPGHGDHGGSSRGSGSPGQSRPGHSSGSPGGGGSPRGGNGPSQGGPPASQGSAPASQGKGATPSSEGGGSQGAGNGDGHGPPPGHGKH